jgi:NAD+ diphosphatase
MRLGGAGLGSRAMTVPQGVHADRQLLGNLMLARNVVERAAERRTDSDWLTQRAQDARSRVLSVNGGGAAVVDDGGRPRLRFSSPLDASGYLTFLGLDETDTAIFADHPVERVGDDWAELRSVGSLLDDRDAGLFVAAVALDNWHRTHVRCPRCGAATEPSSAGWSRRCTADGSEHFPRTDPAVIVLVRDREDRALLGRQGRWAEGWFSTLAGFVEAGESAEAAVRREVREESGVVIGDGPDALHYLGSQPWPFPCSLMLGYHAWTDDPDSIDVDGDEIAEARWFTRAELVEACATGTVRLPPDISIARRLIERWYGAELPGDWSRPLGVPR